MANTKAIGVAYADPLFESVTVTGNATVSGITASSFVTAPSIINTNSAGIAAQNAVAGLYFLTSAITANSTLTSAPVGSLATTTNATGLGKLFIADGTKWQYAAVA